MLACTSIDEHDLQHCGNAMQAPFSLVLHPNLLAESTGLQPASQRSLNVANRAARVRP
jgi:hypothetical protein